MYYCRFLLAEHHFINQQPFDAAAQWAGQHAAEMVKGIDEHTRDLLRSEIESAIRGGVDIRVLRERIKQVIDDTSAYRGERIAQTEVMTAYRQGALQTYQASGVVWGEQWVSGQAGMCKLCQALNGQVVRLGEPFRVQVDGETYVIEAGRPAHPNCRCRTRSLTYGQAAQAGYIDTEPLTRHLPGQHDQKDHGRKRGKRLAGEVDRRMGFSYNPYTLASPKTGYMVSVNPEFKRRYPKDEFTAAELNDYIKEVEPLLRNDPNVYIGGWFDMRQKQPTWTYPSTSRMNRRLFGWRRKTDRRLIMIWRKTQPYMSNRRKTGGSNQPCGYERILRAGARNRLWTPSYIGGFHRQAR